MKTAGIRLLSIFLFALMLLFPADTLSGASAGLLLWFQTVLPTLLPAMILADYLIRVGADRYISRLAARPFGLLFGVSPQGAYAVLVGFLCGYPMGAKTSASLLSEERIDRREASYLLSFCNQPSPMFLIGFLCLSLLQTPEGGAALVLPMLAGVYGSAFFISACYRALRRMDRRMQRALAFDEAPSSTVTTRRTDDAFSAAASRRQAGNTSSAKKTTDSSPLSLPLRVHIGSHSRHLAGKLMPRYQRIRICSRIKHPGNIRAANPRRSHLNQNLILSYYGRVCFLLIFRTDKS